MPCCALVDVVVALRQQLLDDVLHVLADVAGLGQRGRVGHGERHVEQPGQGLGQQGLARTGRADQQDVGLGQLHVLVALAALDPLVVVVHGHGEVFFARCWPITYWSRTSRISRGLGSELRADWAFSSSSSRMMSLQSSTHSSQMNTLGPAISLRTSCWLLPQNEQYRILLLSPVRPCRSSLMLGYSSVAVPLGREFGARIAQGPRRAGSAPDPAVRGGQAGPEGPAGAAGTGFRGSAQPAWIDSSERRSSTWSTRP